MYIFPSNYYQNSSKRLHFYNVYFLDRRALPYWKIGETQAFISVPILFKLDKYQKNKWEREKESKKEKRKEYREEKEDERERNWKRNDMKERKRKQR